jgi:hypothetical protein
MYTIINDWQFNRTETFGTYDEAYEQAMAKAKHNEHSEKLYVAQVIDVLETVVPESPVVVVKADTLALEDVKSGKRKELSIETAL